MEGLNQRINSRLSAILGQQILRIVELEESLAVTVQAKHELEQQLHVAPSPPAPSKRKTSPGL